jgi:hypothetical protein
MTVHVADELLAEARKCAGLASDEVIVERALKAFIAPKPVPGGLVGNPQDIIDLFGTVDFDPEYDYKEARRRDLKRIPKDDDC